VPGIGSIHGFFASSQASAIRARVAFLWAANELTRSTKNLEQSLTRNFTAFRRFGWHNDKAESFAFSEVGQTFAGGLGPKHCRYLLRRSRLARNPRRSRFAAQTMPATTVTEGRRCKNVEITLDQGKNRVILYTPQNKRRKARIVPREPVSRTNACKATMDNLGQETCGPIIQNARWNWKDEPIGCESGLQS
jgi:hypothetical protein